MRQNSKAFQPHPNEKFVVSKFHHEDAYAGNGTTEAVP